MTDVIIVGAGPAGSVAAIKLSELGYTVSLYEKEKIPRHKHCGGLLTNRVIRSLDSLGINCIDILSQRINGWRIEVDDEIVDLELDKPGDNVFGNVYRDEFDSYLTRVAAERGAKVIDSTNVSKIVIPERKKEKYSVVTKNDREECEVILGADGAKSIVRRNLGISYPRDNWAVHIESEIPVDRRSIEYFNDKNMISFNYVQEGVAWAFPKLKGNTINVGVGVSVKEARKTDDLLLNIWKKFLQNQEWYNNQSVQHHVEVSPFKGTIQKLGREKVLLLGDAAGLLDPLRGEGISYAIESGLNAAEAVKLHSEGKDVLLDVYTDLMKDVLDEINVYGMKLHNELYVKNKIKSFGKILLKNEEMCRSLLHLSCGLISNKQQVRYFSPIKIIIALLKNKISPWNR